MAEAKTHQGPKEKKNPKNWSSNSGNFGQNLNKENCFDSVIPLLLEAVVFAPPFSGVTSSLRAAICAEHAN